MNSPSETWDSEARKPVYFYRWFLVDQKGPGLLLLSVAAGVLWAVWMRDGSSPYTVVALVLLLATIGQALVPVHFEINSEGIVRWSVGRKRLIAWEDIRAYQVRKNGVLVLPQRDRYPLEAFRGFFLPVPAALMPEILYRFRVFVDKTNP